MNELEKYINLDPVISEVLPKDAPSLLSDVYKCRVAGCTGLLRDNRWVLWSFQANPGVTGGGPALLVNELFDTLILSSLSRCRGTEVVNDLAAQQNSPSSFYSKTDSVRNLFVYNGDAKMFSKVPNHQTERQIHLWSRWTLRTWHIAGLSWTDRDKKKKCSLPQNLLSYFNVLHFLNAMLNGRSVG